MKSSPNHDRAFTLIELLVVISIIVLLLSILAPAMDKALEMSESTVCKANLHNWGLAIHQYGIENKRRVPHFLYQEKGINWWNVVLPYLGISEDPAKNPPKPGSYNEPAASMLCAATDVLPFNANVDTDPKGVWAAYGTADRTWAYQQQRGSYSANLWFFYRNIYERDQNPGFGVTKITQAPGDMPMVSDGNWIEHLPISEEIVNPVDFSKGKGGSNMGRLSIDRHQFGINTIRVDGSSDHIDLRDLWKQTWHRGFEKHEATTANFHDGANQ